jgi:hypothetical protein
MVSQNGIAGGWGELEKQRGNIGEENEKCAHAGVPVWNLSLFVKSFGTIKTVMAKPLKSKCQTNAGFILDSYRITTTP